MPPALFDILRKQEDGSLVWLKASSDIHTAKSRTEQLGRSSPGRTLIFNQKTQSIVAEVAVWGHETLRATGLGSYIATATATADYRRMALGTVMMSLYVVVVNRFFWRPLYNRSERKFRLN